LPKARDVKDKFNVGIGTMKFQDIKNKSSVELQEMLKELRVNLGKFRFDLSNNSLKNVSQISKARKDIARILTVEKQLKV